MPVESFIESEELMQEFVNKNYACPISGGFNSDELQKPYKTIR